MYEEIQVPVKGQPISSGGYGIPSRNAIIDLGRRVSLLEANLSLPTSVGSYGNGINTLASSASVWANLPSFPASVTMTNPSDVFALVCNVYFGAWMQTTAGQVRIGVNVTGGVVSDPDIGLNSPTGYGLLPQSSATASDQHMGFFELVIPPSAATVTLTAQGWRSSGSSTALVNYPTVNCVPARFQLP